MFLVHFAKLFQEEGSNTQGNPENAGGNGR